MKPLSLGKLALGRIPRVVGTLSSWDALTHFPRSDRTDCDVAEVRLDQIGPEQDWAPASQAIEKAGTPTILTLRMVAEGGKCASSDAARLSIFQQALPLVSAIDVEHQSSLAPQLYSRCQELSKVMIVSFHDFGQTPEPARLSEVITNAASHASIVKISTRIESESDIQVLANLLRQDWGIPLCIIGMGSAGTETRLSFPCLGSVLTYGYLDTPSAPGQLSARDLVANLRQRLPEYNQDFLTRHPQSVAT